VTELIYSPRAVADIERLSEFLLESDPRAAVSTFDLIVSALEILIQHPLIGRRVEDDLRELVISRGHSGYLALYHHDPVRDEIVVHAIRHQREAGFSEWA
jgi:plasmid stabilization system protein ParE